MPAARSVKFPAPWKEARSVFGPSRIISPTCLVYFVTPLDVMCEASLFDLPWHLLLCIRLQAENPHKFDALGDKTFAPEWFA